MGENWLQAVAGVWEAASVWQCVLTEPPLRHFKHSQLCTDSPPGCSGCLICSLHAEHLPIWPEAMERLVLSVSALLRIVRSPLSNPPTGWPAGSEDINQEERQGKGDTLYAAAVLLFRKRQTPRSLPVVISFEEWSSPCGSLAAAQQLSFTSASYFSVQFPPNIWTRPLHDSFCTNI